MKTYAELTKKQQAAAFEYHLNLLLGAVVEGAVRFNDGLNGDDLQARIEGAKDDMDKLDTPWFYGEAIMDAAGDDLRGMAQCDAENTMYAEPDDPPIVCVWDLLPQEEADPAIMAAPWYASWDNKRQYIVGPDEIEGPDDETADALGMWCGDAEFGLDALAESLELTRVPDNLKRWSPEEGYYHA
jgi:hypothetical protein